MSAVARPRKRQRLKPLRALLYKSRQVIQQGMGDTEPGTETDNASRQNPKFANDITRRPPPQERGPVKGGPTG